MPLAAIQSAKIELRRRALATRHELFATRGPAAAQALAANVMAKFADPKGRIIAGYWPIGSEIDCRPTLTALHRNGALLCLPIAGQRGDRLMFRKWSPDDALEQGPFGTFHPLPSAPTIEPSTLLIPLLAFDAQCQRLGYGAGFYDRTLSAMRATKSVVALGIAFDEQETPHIPAEPTDAALDGVITDKRLLTFTPAK